MTGLDLDALLQRLHLKNAARVWRRLCHQAQTDHWTFEHFLGVLIAEEVAQRVETPDPSTLKLWSALHDEDVGEVVIDRALEMPPPRVLVVDDDDLVLYTALAALADIAIAEGCTNAPEALKRIQGEPFDLFLVDLRMQEMDGLTLIREATKCRPELMPIIMTGYPDLDSATAGFKAGAYDYLIKPFEPDLMRAAVLRAWEKVWLRRQRRLLFRELSQRNQALEVLQQEFVKKEGLATFGQLGASFVHELGNPLTIISSAIQTLDVGLRRQGDDRYQLTEVILEQVNRMDEVLLSLRDLATSRPRWVQGADLAQLLDKVQRLIAPECAKRGIDLQIDRPAGGAIGHFDVSGIFQVLLNLVVNAMDALAGVPGGWLALRLHSSDGRSTIEVANNGPSIPETRLDDIFEPFVTTKTHGMGVGLYLARTVARQTGGELLCNNRLQGGVVFTLSLPLFKQATPSAAAARAAVLVVDDDRNLLWILERILKDAGFDVTTAKSAEAALLCFQQAPCDAVLTDYRLPGMSGVELISQLRTLDPDCRLILMTSYGSKEVEQGIVALGAAYLRKPLQNEELIAFLGQVSPRRSTPSPPG